MWNFFEWFWIGRMVGRALNRRDRGRDQGNGCLGTFLLVCVAFLLVVVFAIGVAWAAVSLFGTTTATQPALHTGTIVHAQAAITPTTYDNPHLGGKYDDFVHAYGQPVDCSKFAYGTGFNCFANGIDLENGSVDINPGDTIQSISGTTLNGPNWQNLMPPDAKLVRETTGTVNGYGKLNTYKVYVSATLAKAFTPDDFWDIGTHNSVQPGSFTIIFYHDKGQTYSMNLGVY